MSIEACFCIWRISGGTIQVASSGSATSWLTILIGVVESGAEGSKSGSTTEMEGDELCLLAIMNYCLLPERNYSSYSRILPAAIPFESRALESLLGETTYVLA